MYYILGKSLLQQTFLQGFPLFSLSPMTATATATTDTKETNRVLLVHLGPELKRRWNAYSAKMKAAGRKPTAELRKAITTLLDKMEAEASPRQQPPHIPMRQKDETPDDAPKVRLEIRLTPSERDALTKRAKAEDMTAQEWLVAQVRASLTQTHQFGMSELTALGESNYQLLSIGRNLNQIAKHLNEGLPEHFDSDDVEKLRAEIRAHTKKVSKTMRANLERWQIE
jgi:hypothetical protein